MIPVRLFMGKIRALPESGRPSAIYKSEVWQAIEVTPLGLLGDEQADLRVHGGPDKAVHLYPAQHYARLRERFPDITSQLVPGSLGENISADGLDEHAVQIGDIWRFGDARLQVCQPRSPCWKIDERFGCEGIAEFIARERLTGWYWRVLSPGTADPAAGLTLDEAASNSLTLGEGQNLMQQHRPALAALEQLAECPGIADNWRQKIVQRCHWLRQNPDRNPPLSPGFHVKPENTP